MNDADSRRAFLAIAIAGAGALLAACRKQGDAPAPSPAAGGGPAPAGDAGPNQEEKGEDVGAVEDLMREHGVIRRVLVVYREASARLRNQPSAVAPGAVQSAAQLIRTFAEDYHEKQLEEGHIFPALIRATGTAGPLASTVSTLIAQHQRGREITEYILAVTQGAMGARTAEALARTLEAFARMYEEHAAVEDTIVFPAWKKILSSKELDEMGDRFEDIEHQTFGKDGFDDAVEKVAAIEKAMGIGLAGLTPPPPPRT
jgi:hemerythrin-like domain-containing protein